MPHYLKDYEYQYFKYGQWVTVTYQTYRVYRNSGYKIRKRLKTSMKWDETSGIEITEPDRVKVTYFNKRKGKWCKCCEATYYVKKREGKVDEIKREVEYGI